MLTQNRDYIPIFILTRRSWKCAERSPWYCSTGERSNNVGYATAVCVHMSACIYTVYTRVCVCARTIHCSCVYMFLCCTGTGADDDIHNINQHVP